MEIIFAVAAKIAEYTVDPVGRQLNYLFCYTTNVQNLRNQLQHLKNAEEIMKHDVNGAINNCEEIYAGVESWLSSVDEVSSDANTFLNLDNHEKVVSSCGSSLHLVTRHQLSRQAHKISIRVLDAWERRKFESISYRPLIQSSFATKGYEIFDSREGILKDIMVAVRDVNRSRIGLHGMPGIGKTMLVTKIARQVQKEKLFNMVVMTPISQTPNLKEIQQCIADKLGLKFGETDRSMDKRAILMQERLKPDKNILLILDDVWDEFNLQKIGIHEECRMLLTSRTRDVLRNFMGIAESDVFLLEALDSSEATSLFKKIIGDNIVENADYNSLADDIVQECGGLPISIATVANALKCNIKLHIWKDALERLKNSNFKGIDKVYSSIRLSYDFLGTHEEVKSLLLLCALHKEDADIGVEDLVRYSVGFCFLEDVNTMNQARDRVNSLVDKLKSHCLLQDSRKQGYVKVHDVIRDVCISILKEDKHWMNNITSATMYDKFVDDRKDEASKVISFLSYDDYKNLPQKLKCPSLELLLMSSLSLESISNVFFEQTRKLKALAMNHTCLRSLPQSFQSVQNLQTLCLQGSSLEDIAVIGELKKLKVLDLSWSKSIELLPKEIGQLQHLQLLDLRGCYCLTIIEPDVISKLTRMEELYLPEEFKGWETDESSMKERRNVSLEEIKSLQQMSCLYLSIPRANIVPQEMFSGNLERYKIHIGDNCQQYPSRIEVSLYQRWLDLTLSTMDEINAFGLTSLITRSEYLSLEGLMDVTNIAPCFDEKVCIPNLKELILKSCNHLKYLFSISLAQPFVSLKRIEVRDCKAIEDIGKKVGEEEIKGNILFPKLEFLELVGLLVLQKFCAVNSCMEFPVLSNLIIQDCPKLKIFVSFPTVVQVNHLESPPFFFNEKMEMILFPKLKSLELYGLSDLKQFCISDSCMEFSLISKIIIKNCPKLKALVSSPSGDHQKENQLLSTKVSFPNLEELIIESCDNLIYLFSFSLAQQKFVKLKKIKVKDCKAMKDIGVKVGEEEIHMEMILFPKLEDLELVGLSNLQRFCATDSYMEFPLLSKLNIQDCPKLKIFVSSPTGDHQEINQLVSIQSFFNEKVSFPNLEELIIESCDNLKYLISFSLAQQKFVKLKKIKVKDCKAVKDIGVKVGEEEIQMEMILFPKLEDIELVGLSNLQRFSHMEFPLLSKLNIQDCPKLKIFVSSLNVDHQEINQFVSIQSFFNEKDDDDDDYQHWEDLGLPRLFSHEADDDDDDDQDCEGDA